MLSDEELDKLCPGRIVLANAFSSSGRNATVPHYCIILDGNPKDAGAYFATFVSHNDKIDSSFIMPIPAYTGLTGNIVGSWTDHVHEPGILEIKSKLLAVDLLQVRALVKAAKKSK